MLNRICAGLCALFAATQFVRIVAFGGEVSSFWVAWALAIVVVEALRYALAPLMAKE